MRLPEVYPSLEKGVKDGGVYSFERATIFKYAEATKYVMGDSPASDQFCAERILCHQDEKQLSTEL